MCVGEIKEIRGIRKKRVVKEIRFIRGLMGIRVIGQ